MTRNENLEKDPRKILIFLTHPGHFFPRPGRKALDQLFSSSQTLCASGGMAVTPVL